MPAQAREHPAEKVGELRAKAVDLIRYENLRAYRDREADMRRRGGALGRWCGGGVPRGRARCVPSAALQRRYVVQPTHTRHT